MNNPDWKEQQLINEIIKKAFEKRKNKSVVDIDKLNSTLESICEVTGMSRKEAEQIANEVIEKYKNQSEPSQRHQKNSTKVAGAVEEVAFEYVSVFLFVFVFYLASLKTPWCFIVLIFALLSSALVMSKYSIKYGKSKAKLAKAIFYTRSTEVRQEEKYVTIKRQWESQGWREVEYVNDGTTAPSFIMFEK
ncbi:hypothetical protein MHO82_12975 [Vibrio sp. Of7-15]|uniref:hypothetical protein n=1 Tax=Vibrio sp. Of7-15 TaxID=2724879 RepID=UPI001EF2A3CD|nr:hypothetical protein [Vibrio sp. Of7-15]MCG7497777.1 hypothetical protein [Vibrio sp. Of7-15]